MNIYEKLQQARIALKEMNLKKSGANTFAKYTYYELEDFLPQILDLCNQYKILTHVTFDTDEAKLTIVDCEKPSDILEFTSPMVESEVKGANKIQNLGAAETYQRRYLYMIAFELCETDGTDKTTEDISLHSIFKIKQRVEELVTAKLKNGLTKAELLSGLRLTEKQFESYLSYYESLSKFETAIQKL